MPELYRIAYVVKSPSAETDYMPAEVPVDRMQNMLGFVQSQDWIAEAWLEQFDGESWIKV